MAIKNKFLLVLIKALLHLLYAIVVTVTCFGVSLWFASPVVLGYIVVMTQINRPITLLHGNYLYLWLCAITIIFVPLLIYSIIYRIRLQIKKKKAIQEALAKAKAEGEKKQK